MKSNIKDWNTEMKIRLLRKMSNWHLKHYDKESGQFSKPSVYNWSDRNDVDYSGKDIKSPDYMWHELDYVPRDVIYDGDTDRFGCHINYNFNGNEYKVVPLPYHFTYYPNIKKKGRRHPFPYEFEYDREYIPLDYYWCCKIERYIDKFRGREVYRNNINKFLAVDIMKRAYEMYVFLDDYKYRIQQMIDICTEAYKEKASLIGVATECENLRVKHMRIFGQRRKSRRNARLCAMNSIMSFVRIHFLLLKR